MKPFYLLLAAILFSCADPAADLLPNTHELPNEAAQLDILTESDAESGVKLEAYWKLFKQTLADDHCKASTYLDHQLALAEQVENLTFQGLAYHGKGLVNKKQGNYDKAVEYYLSAIDVFEENNDDYRRIHNVNNIGSLLIRVGGYDVAIEYLQKALDYYQSNGHERFAQTVLVNLGECYANKQQPDFDQAEHHYIEAIALQKQAGANNNQHLAFLQNEVGIMNFKAQRYPQAITAYQSALAFANKMDKPTEMKTNLYINLAESAMKLEGEYHTLAGKWIDKAIALSPDMTKTDEQTAIKRLNTVGRYFQEVGKFEQAIESYKKAIAIANKAVINQPLRETLNLITSCYESMVQMSISISYQDLFRIEEIEEQQQLLETGFTSSLNTKGLSNILQEKIKMHQKMIEAATEQRQLAVAWQVIGALTVLLLFCAFFFWRFNFRM